MGGDEASASRERAEVELIGSGQAVVLAIIPAGVIGVLSALAGGGPTATNGLPLILGIVGFVVAWVFFALLIRVGYAVINIERLLRDRP